MSDLRRNFLPENVETTVAIERGLLLHEFPALLGLVVKQHLKAALAGGIFVSVVGSPELFDAVLPLSAHELKVLLLGFGVAATCSSYSNQLDPVLDRTA
jgi:hypothetical protein